MRTIAAALIHMFFPSADPAVDEDGELLLGAYYQFIDQDNVPIGGLIGPYLDNEEAEKAADREFNRR